MLCELVCMAKTQEAPHLQAQLIRPCNRPRQRRPDPGVTWNRSPPADLQRGHSEPEVRASLSTRGQRERRRVWRGGSFFINRNAFSTRLMHAEIFYVVTVPLPPPTCSVCEYMLVALSAQEKCFEASESKMEVGVG